MAERTGGEVVAGDIGDIATLEAAIEYGVRENRFGRLDVLLQQCRHPALRHAETTTDAVWDEVFDVNLKRRSSACRGPQFALLLR